MIPLTSADTGPEPAANVNASSFNNNISENTENINNFSDFNEENVIEEESEPIRDSLKTVLRAVNRNAENNQRVPAEQGSRSDFAKQKTDRIYRQIMTNNGYGDLVRRMDGIASRLGSEVQLYSSNTAEGTRKQNNEEYKKKLTMAGHIDELTEVSKQKNKNIVPDRKNHLFAKDGFNYRRAYFEDADGNYYELTLSVGKNGEVNTVYNINQIKNIKNRSTVKGSSPKNGEAQMKHGTPTGKVSQNVTEVNNEIGTNLGEILREAQESTKEKTA